MKLKTLVALVSAAVAAMLCSCQGDALYRHYDGAVWATTFHITYRSDRVLDDSIQSVMSRVEHSLSPFSDASLVTAVNECRTTDTDSLFRRIFTASSFVSRASGGRYDPTVMPLVELWGFGRHKNVAEPTQAEIDSALAGVGILRCRLEGDRIVKASPATRFDFSSITKGYGCDLVGEMLRRNGCTDYMVEIGGEMALSGRNPHGEPWHVMVEAPIDNDSTVEHHRMAVMVVSDCGVATSGNYRNYRDFASGRKGHTISPLTGRPVSTTTLSATVVAPDAMMADALATACMTMPPDEALRMIASMPDTYALIVAVGHGGGWKRYLSDGFPPLSD